MEQPRLISLNVTVREDHAQIIMNLASSLSETWQKKMPKSTLPGACTSRSGREIDDFMSSRQWETDRTAKAFGINLSTLWRVRQRKQLKPGYVAILDQLENTFPPIIPVN